MSLRKSMIIILALIGALILGDVFVNAIFASKLPGLIEVNLGEEEKFRVRLDGDWYFFHEQLLNPEEALSAIRGSEQATRAIPGSFEDHAGETNTFATYVLEVKLPDYMIGRSLALHVPFQYSAYRLFVNQVEVASNGLVGSNEATHETEMEARTGEFVLEDSTLYLTMQISSFKHIRGGFENSIYLGQVNEINKSLTKAIIYSLFLIGIIFIISLFLILIGLNNIKEFGFLVFGLLSMTVSLWSIFTAPFYYTMIFPDLPWLWGTRIEYLLAETASIYFVLLFWFWHRENFRKEIMYIIILLFMGLIFITLFTEPVFFQQLYFKVYLIAIPFGLYGIYVVVKSIKKNNKYVKVNIVGLSLVFFGFFSDYSLGRGWHSGPMLMLPSLSIFILIHVIYMSRNYAESFKEIEEQNKVLRELNESNEKLSSQLQEEIINKDEFLLKTSHELRNPLHGIINIAHSILLHKSYLLDEKSKQDLELQISIGRHMSRTLEDLLELTRLREKKVELLKEKVFLRSVSRGIVDMFSVLTETKRVDIEVKIPKDFPALFVDKNRLIQILFNVIHQSVKYTKRGSIVIDAEVLEKQVRIFVRGIGAGNRGEEFRKILTSYKQVESGSLPSHSSLGMGLDISKQLIELHNGQIEVNDSHGKGLVFSFTLPLYDEGVHVEKTNSHVIESRNPFAFDLPITLENAMSKAFMGNGGRNYRPKILAIDHDIVNLKVLSNILSEDQYEVKLATKGKDVLAAIEEEQWDLIISDVMMPNMSGYELTRIIRERYSIAELPILLMTARDTIEDVYTAFLAGANDYVAKPIDAIELNVRVQTLTNLQESINERLKMEAAWLQAQIRPHFLLNTLNSIVSLSEFDIKRMNELIEHFINYLQSSFYYKNLKQLVPLEDELSLIGSYLYIEKTRFGERLRVVWDIDETIEADVPPLSIQTLVENAINHGVLKRIDGGTVTIQIVRVDNQCEVSIIDDGVGIDNKRLQNLFKLPSSHDGGIGLVNTEDRLRRLFGSGLHITSTLGVGTVVSFKVPIKTISEMDNPFLK